MDMEEDNDNIIDIENIEQFFNCYKEKYNFETTLIRSNDNSNSIYRDTIYFKKWSEKLDKYTSSGECYYNYDHRSKIFRLTLEFNTSDNAYVFFIKNGSEKDHIGVILEWYYSKVIELQKIKDLCHKEYINLVSNTDYCIREYSINKLDTDT